MNSAQSSRSGIRPWHIAGVVLVLAVIGLTGYAFWPTITGEAEASNTDTETERVVSRARVEVIIVEPSDFVLRAEATGHLMPWRVAEISAEGSGVVRERLVEEGHRVIEGDMLFRLDDADEKIALDEAKSILLKAQAEYARLIVGDVGAISPDSSWLSDAREIFLRAEEAFERREITVDELQVARRNFEAMEIRSGGKRAEVRAAMSGLSAAEQGADRAKLGLSRTVVVAPFAGRVSDIETEVGKRVAVGTELLTLRDDSRMKVDVNVLEADLVNLVPGGTARIRIPALKDTVLTGSIYSINPSIDPETGTGRVRVSLANPRGRLISGLFAYVELEIGRESDRLVVPTESVLVRQGRDLVFVIEDGRAQWVYVTVGKHSGALVELIEPVSPGDSVAVAGHHALSHDARVEVGAVRSLLDFR